MSINPTRPSTSQSRQTPEPVHDEQIGRPRKTGNAYRTSGLIGGVIVLALAISFFFMRYEATTPRPTAQTIGKTDQAQKPVPVTPSQSTPTTP